MEDIQKAIAFSRGIWFCLMHPYSFKEADCELTEEDLKLCVSIYSWIDRGLNLYLSPQKLSAYKNWFHYVVRGNIKYFSDNIPDSIMDMSAELYEADKWIPFSLISKDVAFHRMFIDCLQNNPYFKKDPPGIALECILDSDDCTFYANKLTGYLCLLRGY